MRGHHPILTKRFPNTMVRHMTLSYTSEYRTSQQCSEQCTDDFQRLKNVKHKDSKDTTFAVKYCDQCNTFWNRDVNAARNILHKCLRDQVDDYRDPHFSAPLRLHVIRHHHTKDVYGIMWLSWYCNNSEFSPFIIDNACSNTMYKVIQYATLL